MVDAMDCGILGGDLDTREHVVTVPIILVEARTTYLSMLATEITSTPVPGLEAYQAP
jgi:hypothetical protein